MSTAAVVLWQVFYAPGGGSFNVHEGSSNVVETVVRSRFIGREHDLLVLRNAFFHMGNRTTIKELAISRGQITQFLSRPFNMSNTELILCINTHAEARDGGLLFAPGKVTSLDSVLEHVCGDISLAEFRSSTLFIICCGGLIKRACSEVRRASQRFDTVYAFNAPMLDPIMMSCHFITTILDFNIFGREPFFKTLQRTAKAEVLSHTAVFAGKSGKIYRVRMASLRRAPNGEAVRCCGQVAKYMETRNGRIRFRCVEPAHHGRPRSFALPLLLAKEGVRWVLGTGTKCRYIIDIV
ncbi:hypothetical protein OH77DRAFT_1402054 [Trametes cingulata]|nr:hypothetical protein OH77DRAFT_1402054 [Trametes cingulata]